ncbi:MAG: hypothetical protein M1823_002393 [Watsoniomyces obsoletus]|nr:MAG: hypothetical protein M1823_002393 [Watsoniomyces obsoletus]
MGNAGDPTHTWSPESTKHVRVEDVFEKGRQQDEPGTSADLMGAPATMDGSEELPIELLSLSDRFIDSLSAKVHPTPPTVDKLSTFFQDFYELAASHISTHIKSEASRQRLGGSRTPSQSSRSSSLSQTRPRSNSAKIKDHERTPTETPTAQQMLTTTEIEDRRRARVELERKRLRLEEAAERRVCEAVYDRIWRHRSTHDEARDEKLRSRTAALRVVGIGLKELGVEVQTGGSSTGREEQIREWLESARVELAQMNDDRYPLGKLRHLKAAHKGIVDTLSRLHPSSSSADEVLPTLIFTLITNLSDRVNVISDLLFIQRFRAASKIDGEAAYCLTNLEAAISFLEHVDIASLREDEASPSKVAPQLPTSYPAAYNDSAIDSRPSSPMVSPTPTSPAMSAFKERATTSRTSSHHRRISELLQPSTNAIGAAGEAMLNHADQSFKTIGHTLDFSYNLVFGRLKERHLEGPGVADDGTLVLPKTLDEARKLVSTPPPSDVDGSTSLATGQLDGMAPRTSDKFLTLLGGTKMARDKSSDSTRSAGSGKKVSFAEGLSAPKGLPSGSGASITSAPAAPSAGTPLGPAMESMRNLGSSLNPLNRLAGMNAMLSFGRSTSSPPPSVLTPEPSAEQSHAVATATASTVPVTANGSPQNERPKLTPPIAKFMAMNDPGDLKMSDVAELLRDYQRLATAVQELGLVSDEQSSSS